MGVVLIGSSKDPNKIKKENQNRISLAARSEVARRFTSWLQVLLMNPAEVKVWLGATVFPCHKALGDAHSPGQRRGPRRAEFEGGAWWNAAWCLVRIVDSNSRAKSIS